MAALARAQTLILTIPKRYRSQPKRAALSMGIITAGLLAGHHRHLLLQRPMRFDAAPTSGESGRAQRSKALIDAETAKQLSGGSLSGFVAGILVSVLSTTLVLLAGIAMVIIQVAARNGINLVEQLKLKRRVRVLAALDERAAFKLSFAVAFTLSAFVSL